MQCNICLNISENILNIICPQLNDQIFTMMNIKHAVSSAYHPQTNGQVTCTIFVCFLCIVATVFTHKLICTG